MEVGILSLNLRFAHFSDFNFFFLHHSSVSSKFQMGCIQHCHRSRHLTISVLFLLISSLAHVRFTAEGREMSKPVDQASQKGREEKVVVVVVVVRSVIGSRPPRCERRCRSCGHCEAIQVPVAPQLPRSRHFSTIPKIADLRGDDISNYKPMCWKCKCGNLVFNP